MNRRELIAGAAAVAAAAPLAAQTSTSAEATGQYAIVGQAQPEVSPEERTRQYEICKLRGHMPTNPGNAGSMAYASPAIFIAVPPGPAMVYPNVGAGAWQECWYCKTRWRFVTTMEEENKP